MKRLSALLTVVMIAVSCATNPYTGKTTMALVDNDSLLASSFSQYKQFLNESSVVLGHEVAHALLNHGQQRSSAAVLQQAGAIGVGVLTANRGQGAET
jgi:hypothetical protein